MTDTPSHNRRATDQQGHTHANGHMVHEHRAVQGGAARAAVFGVSDGLVSNVALIIGVAAATPTATTVVIAAVSGLLAGAASMAAGEWVSMKAQNELIERELEIERRSIADNAAMEERELAAIYKGRGISSELADQLAAEMMVHPDIALEVHAREELGVDPDDIGDPVASAGASFVAFAIGATVPIVPWFIGEGNGAIIASIALGIAAAAAVGIGLAHFTERPRRLSAFRQVAVLVVTCTLTYVIGTILGETVL